MLVFRLLYKVLKKLFIIQLLENLNLITIKLEKHEIIYLNQKALIIIFIGTYGGYSLIIKDYYLNLSNRLFFCNYYKLLNKKEINIDVFCIDSKNRPVLPLSILESIVLDNDSSEHLTITYPIKLESATYACIFKNSKYKNVIINKAGGFFHFYIEVLPLLIEYNNKPLNVYFMIERHNFYDKILKFYNILYIVKEKPTENITYLPMYRYYPSIKHISKLMDFNQRYVVEDTPKKFLYVTRRNERSRRISNENDLINILNKFHFVIIDPGNLDFNEQINYFRNAKIIISSHGAALSNIIWCEKGAKIIELNGDKDCRWHFAKISLLLHFEYKLIIGKTIDEVYFEICTKTVENSILKLLD